MSEMNVSIRLFLSFIMLIMVLLFPYSIGETVSKDITLRSRKTVNIKIEKTKIHMKRGICGGARG